MDRLGFKATHPDMRCQGMQFEMGTVHRHDSKLEMCKSGFHFCLQLKDVHEYYSFLMSRVFIVQHGAHVLSGYDKCVTDEIVLLREITGETIQELMSAPEYASLLSDNTAGLLSLFVARSDVETVRYVLHHGADVHAYDDDALRYASANGLTEVVAVLLEHGANVHAVDDCALRMASANGYKDVVALLLQHDANVHAVKDTALRRASENGHRDIVGLLLDHGADVHAADDWALKWATINGHTDAARVLLEHGADVHALRDYLKRWESDPVAVLLEKGAKPQ
jgi:ankyrin repeat protein